MLSDRLECLDLLLRVCDAGNWPKAMFGQSRRVRVLCQAQDGLPDVGRETQEHEHLGHTRPADALAAGDVRLPLHRAGVELPLPFEGLTQRFDHRWRPRFAGRSWRLRRPGRMTRRRDGADHAAGGHLARQDADVAVLERPVRPQDDFDGLFAEFERTLDVVGGDMDNTEPDLRDGPSGLTEGTPGRSNEKLRNRAAQRLTQKPGCESGRAFVVTACGQSVRVLAGPEPALSVPRSERRC